MGQRLAIQESAGKKSKESVNVYRSSTKKKNNSEFLPSKPAGLERWMSTQKYDVETIVFHNRWRFCALDIEFGSAPY